MKFVILTQYFPPEIGAAQTRLAAVARELTARGHDVEIITAFPNYPQGSIFGAYKGKFYSLDEYDGIPVHRSWLFASVGSGWKRILNYLSFSLTSLYSLLKVRNADFLFIESPPLSLAIPGILFARWIGARAIFNVADLWPDSVVEMGLMKEGLFIRLARRLENWTYRKADFVIAMTEGIRDTLLKEKRVPREKVLFLPNGVDLQRYGIHEPDIDLKKSLGFEQKKIVLYQGTQGYAHGLEAVLQAAALMRHDTDVHFLFVGNGSERKHLETLKEQLQLDNVTFLDSVPLSQLPRFFSIAVCGLVSLKDNDLFKGARPAKCNPILASGKPVLFFGEGEGAELVKSANAGIVVPYGELKGFTNAVRQLTEHLGFGTEQGRNGRRYAEQHLGWSALVGAWLADLTQRCKLRTDAPGLKARGSEVT